MAFQDHLQISRQKLEFIYSILILVVVPVLVIVQTIILTSDVRENFNVELRDKSDLANSILGESIKGQLDDTEEIQSILNSINENVEDIEVATVIDRDGSNYTIIASTNPDLIGQDVSQDLAVTGVVSANMNSETSYFVSTEKPSSVNSNNRSWTTLSPIFDDNEEIVAIIGTDVSLVNSDALISSMLSKSLFVLVAIVTVIVILLLNHFKFVEYAMLFRKLKEVDQLKSDFLSVATHELKSPMAVIKGTIENILDGVVGHVDEAAKKSLKTAHAETDRLGNLVTDLLNVSRIEQGQVTYNKEHVVVSDIVDEVVKRYQDKAKEKGLKLEYEAPEKHYVIDVDKGRLIEITTNLVDNAIKYSREGSVTIRHELDGKQIKTKVKDTGIGMSAKEREHLFNRFYRIKNDKTKDISGTGLGLWIIKQYIESMGGHIYVESLEGVGSEFTYEFPLVQEKDPPPDQAK